MADLFDQPEVLTRVALDVVNNQKKEIARLERQCDRLESLCKDLYLVARDGYIDESLHNRLVELGFAEGSE